jgi:GT2 family glycosyltransferase
VVARSQVAGGLRASSYTELVATLTAVIPATDGRVTLARAIAAIERADEPPEQVVVVDEPQGLGPGGARNLGAQRALGDILVFVDADVEVHHDAFVRIREAFEREPQLAAVFGSYDDQPHPGGVVSDFRNLLHHHVHHENAGPAATFWAGLGAIRLDTFLDVGGFDEQRFVNASVEDIELGSRLHERGYRIRLDPAIQGKHLKRWTLGSMIETDLFRRGVPWLRLLLERRTSTTALNLGWRHRLSAVVSVALLVALVRRSAVLAAAALAALTVLDRPFYGLLFRRRGVGLVVVGMPLHLIHRLVSVAAVPIAVVQHVGSRRKSTRRSGGLPLSFLHPASSESDRGRDLSSAHE